MKNKRLWLSVTLTVLVVVCAMLILSRINETRSNAAPAAPTDLILPPDIQTTAQPDTKKYDDLPDVDISPGSISLRVRRIISATMFRM